MSNKGCVTSNEPSVQRIPVRSLFPSLLPLRFFCLHTLNALSEREDTYIYNSSTRRHLNGHEEEEEGGEEIGTKLACYLRLGPRSFTTLLTIVVGSEVNEIDWIKHFPKEIIRSIIRFSHKYSQRKMKISWNISVNNWKIFSLRRFQDYTSRNLFQFEPKVIKIIDSSYGFETSYWKISK